MTRSEYLKQLALNRRVLVPALAAGYVAVSVWVCSDLHRKTEDLNRLRSDYHDLLAIGGSILPVTEEIRALQERGRHKKYPGFMAAAADLVAGLGLREKLKTIDPPRNVAVREYEEGILYFEGVRLNEAVNLFYRVKNGPYPFSIRNVELKRNFEKTDLLNLRCSLVFWKTTG